MNTGFRSARRIVLRRGAGRAAGAALVAAAIVAAAAVPADAAANPYPETPRDLWGQSGTAYAVEVVGTTAYVGGNFATAARYAQTSARSNLMAVSLGANPPSGSLLPFRQGEQFSINGAVRAVVADGNWLYIGGDFTNVDGTARNRLARVDRNSGVLDQGFNPNVNKPVRDMTVVNGVLYLVGDFTKVGTTTRRRAAAISTANGSLTGFNPNLNAKTYAVAIAPNGRVVLGGNFTTVGGAPQAFLTSIDPATNAPGPAYNGINDIVLDVATSNDRVFVAAGGGFNSVAAWGLNGGALQWRQRANGDVQAVNYVNGNVYFGFHDGFGGMTTKRLMAADAVGGGIVAGFAPDSSGAIGVLGLDSAGPYLVAVGKFPKMGGVNVKGIAAFCGPAGSCPNPY